MKWDFVLSSNLWSHLQCVGSDMQSVLQKKKNEVLMESKAFPWYELPKMYLAKRNFFLKIRITLFPHAIGISIFHKTSIC